MLRVNFSSIPMVKGEYLRWDNNKGKRNGNNNNKKLSLLLLF